MIITDLAVSRRDDHAGPFKLIEMATGVTAEEVAEKTTAHYIAFRCSHSCLELADYPGVAVGSGMLEENTSELPSLTRLPYAGFVLNKKQLTLLHITTQKFLYL